MFSLCVIQAGGSSNLVLEFVVKETAVHADFFNGKASIKNYCYCCFYYHHNEGSTETCNPVGRFLQNSTHFCFRFR